MEPDLRPLPAPRVASTRCEGCGTHVVWAITVAGPNGRGGKLIALNPHEDLRGSYAVTALQPGRGRLLARCLTKDEAFDRPFEYAAMPHVATCVTRSRPELPANVIDLQQQRSRRRRGRRRPTGAQR